MAAFFSFGSLTFAADGVLSARRMHNTVGGFEQLLRDLFLARAVVGVGTQGKTIEGKIVAFAGGVLTIDTSHDKGEYVYIPVSSILFVSQK